MIRFEFLKIYNWMDAIRGMRNSWESWGKSDSIVLHPDEWKYETHFWLHGFEMGASDYSLAMKLAKSGNDHAKYLRQVIVSVDIIAGNEFWKEFDTYKVGTVANSTSMMHKMGSRFLTTSDFSFDVDMPDHLRDLAENAVAITNEAIKAWRAAGKQIGSPEWRLMQKIAPMGFIYRRTCTLNYQVLKNMYHSRKNHRLQEWREFAKWVESLPYSELITLKEDDDHEEAQKASDPNPRSGRPGKNIRFPKSGGRGGKPCDLVDGNCFT